MSLRSSCFALTTGARSSFRHSAASGWLGGVQYPLCSDYWPHGKVTQAYGVFNEEVGRPERAIIVVDAEGICRYVDVHQLREVPDEEEIADELKKLT